MADPGHQRIILLNRLISRSSTRAPQEHSPPFHGAKELLGIIEKRKTKNIAIEYVGTFGDKDDDEESRIERNVGNNFIRLRASKLATSGK